MLHGNLLFKLFKLSSILFSGLFNRWSLFNLLSTESLGGVRFNQANLLIVEIIDCVVVLQELGTKHPVFFAFLATETCEVPWGHKKPSDISALSAHVGVSGHIEVFCLTLSVLDEVEVEVWKLRVLLVSASTSPKRLLWLAKDSVLLVEGLYHG